MKPFLLLSSSIIYQKYQNLVYTDSQSVKKIPESLQIQLKDKTNDSFYFKFKSRQENLQEIISTKQFDVLIIGGGASGAGVFLEATSRGLKVCLLESEDFSSSTSCKSTKLIHGGIRYLQQVFELSTQGHRIDKYKLVKEALQERSHFLENAFYMNKQIPIVIPSRNIFETFYYYTGCVVYHLLYYIYKNKNQKSSFNFPTIMTNDQIKINFPNLDQQYKQGVVYWDGQFNDTRMCLDILLTGIVDRNKIQYYTDVRQGNIMNYAEVNQFSKNQENKITGVQFTDKINNKNYKINAKCVVNCTGIFSDKIRQLDDPKCFKRIILSAGSHITMSQEFSNKKYGLIIPETGDGRIIFILPWLKKTIVGTTEREMEEPDKFPVSSFQEIEFLLQNISKTYCKLTSEQIVNQVNSKWCGIRPLIIAQQQQQQQNVVSKDIARTHVIEESPGGLISLMGGKWTTYRRMGEETTDKIQDFLTKNFGIIKSQGQKSRTMDLKLVGEFLKEQSDILPNKSVYVQFYSKLFMEIWDIDKDVAKYLVKSYGERANDILKLTLQDKSLKERLIENEPFIKAEFFYHIDQEMAQKPTDSICRRTRMIFLNRYTVFKCLPEIMNIYQKKFKWDQKTKQKKLQETLEELKKMDF